MHIPSAVPPDPLFAALTRPPMRWGVTYTALLLNLVLTLEAFLVTRNLLLLGIALPVHGLCVLLCGRDPRIFDLLLLNARTHLPALLASDRRWRAAAYASLPACVGTARHGSRRVPPVRVG